jgi:hypothetical protein
MLGYAIGELHGQRVVDLLPDQAQAVHSAFCQGKPERLTTRVPKVDGRRVDVTLTIEPMQQEAGEIGKVALLCRPLAPWQVAREGGDQALGTSFERDHARSA